MNTRNKILLGILIYLIYVYFNKCKEHFLLHYPISTRNMSYDLRGGIRLRNPSIGSFFHGLFPYWWISPRHPLANYHV